MSEKRPMTNGEACKKMAELFGRNPEGINGMYINGIQVFDGKNWNRPIEVSITRYSDGDIQVSKKEKLKFDSAVR